MICADCQQRDVCDTAGKDSPILVGCALREGTWRFDRMRLERMTADRDRLAAELARVRSASESLASLIRLRYPRLLERGNPLYDATLDAALAQPQDGTTEGMG